LRSWAGTLAAKSPSIVQEGDGYSAGVCLVESPRNDAFAATLHPIGCTVQKRGALLHCINAPETQERRFAMKVKDVMHKGVDWVSPNTPITELAKLMRTHDIGCIPIGEDDKLVGMVTDRDIVCKGLASHSFDAGSATARDVMTEGIHCCREDDDLAKAMHHMEKLQVRRLPVINKSKRMVGMISLGDVSRSASGDLLTETVRSVSAHH